VFVAEHFDDNTLDFLDKVRLPRCMRDKVRHGLPRGRAGCIPVHVWHQDHTDHAAVPPEWRGKAHADRAYRWGRLILDYWGDIAQYIYLDESGVPMLRDPRGPFARCIARKPEMQSRATTEAILLESLGVSEPSGRLPQGQSLTLETLGGIGDHLMLAAVVRAIHRERPSGRIAVRLTHPGLEPWFTDAFPGVEFTNRKGTRLVWLWEKAIPGRHMVELYGATVEDIRLPAPKAKPVPGQLRIAFVGKANPYLPLKTWPHWDRLAELVRERYGVDPVRVGLDVKADPASSLPELLDSFDTVVCTEGMASHVCWAIRKRAVVLVPGAIEAAALAYPGFHTVLQPACPVTGHHCHRYTNNRGGVDHQGDGPKCHGECLSSLRPETVLEAMTAQRRVVNVHFLSKNCGDANCGPSHYFPGMEERSTSQPAVPCDVAIFGGGGIYQDCAYQRAKQYQALGAKVVIWGAGIVTEDRDRGMTPWTWREFGDLAGLCGLREPSPWEFVPCPSCMSSLFDRYRGTEPQHDVVYYNHPDKPVRDGEPRMTNYQTTDLEPVLLFLASGRKVVTSSYHGRIWATWLGRDVELDGPAAERLAQSGPVPPLEEARRINREFWARVRGLPEQTRQMVSNQEEPA